MPEWVLAVILQLPLVAVVTYAFLTGKIHSDAEFRRREGEHDAELKRRAESLGAQITAWHDLYNQERADRLEADKRLSIAVQEIKDATDRVEDLTKEVIRGSGTRS